MNELWLIIIGAFLAIVGGAIGDEIHALNERRRERNAIKIAICDELGEIAATITNIHTVWESAARVIDPKLVSDLLSSTEVYDGLRTRLFLISDEQLRKGLSDFYKKVKDTVRKTEGKIGLTSEAEQGGFDAIFQALGTEANRLKGELA
ncbi:MAG: hypothetical protein IT405_00425 [Candidatus Yanofskybacteria bacterium]|nr:hypothetical protein [Candidatus Yanofskybacteria bacterium]